jgi:hypothetical protein
MSRASPIALPRSVSAGSVCEPAATIAAMAGVIRVLIARIAHQSDPAIA